MRAPRGRARPISSTVGHLAFFGPHLCSNVRAARSSLPPRSPVSQAAGGPGATRAAARSPPPPRPAGCTHLAVGFAISGLGGGLSLHSYSTLGHGASHFPLSDRNEKRKSKKRKFVGFQKSSSRWGKTLVRDRGGQIQRGLLPCRTSDEKVPSAETANPTAAELKLRDGGDAAAEYFNRASKPGRRPRPGAGLCARVQWRARGVARSSSLPSTQQKCQK